MCQLFQDAYGIFFFPVFFIFSLIIATSENPEPIVTLDKTKWNKILNIINIAKLNNILNTTNITK